jgi:hypothetical protein
MVAILTTPFTFLSEEAFWAGEVCEMPVLLWNRSTQQRSIIANIQPGGL